MRKLILTIGLAIAVIALVQPAVTQEGYPGVTLYGAPFGGTDTYRNIDLGATKQEVKATQGNIYGWHLFNSSNATRYFKFIYQPAASVTVGTTTPDLTIPIPAGAGANVPWPQGINFRNGLTVYCVTGVADNSTAAPSTNDCIMDLFYK